MNQQYQQNLPPLPPNDEKHKRWQEKHAGFLAGGRVAGKSHIGANVRAPDKVIPKNAATTCHLPPQPELNKKTAPETEFVVRLRPVPDGPDACGRQPDLRLKQALKLLLRVCGLRCVQVEQVSGNSPTRKADCE